MSDDSKKKSESGQKKINDSNWEVKKGVISENRHFSHKGDVGKKNEVRGTGPRDTLREEKR